MEITIKRENTSIDDILNLKVSYQPNAWSAFNKEVSIKEVLVEIKNETHLKQVNSLRSLLKSGDKEKYNIHKKNLPAVTFCGTFNKERKKTALKSYNNLVVLDIDKLNEEEFQRVKECFCKDAFVLAFWESPSQLGIKGLVHLSYNTELNSNNLDNAHKAAFRKLAKYFLESHNIELDNSGSDTTRLCFLSYDPLIEIKKSVTSFKISDPDILDMPETKEKSKKVIPIHKSNRDALFNPKDRNDPRYRKTIQAVIRFLEKRKLSITASYEEWYRVSLAIANTFTYDIGEKYFQRLSSLDKKKYNETNCKNMLLNCYEIQTGEITFKTIEYFAKQKGYIIKSIREESSETANENLSQVSTSDNGSLPEVLKSD